MQQHVSLLPYNTFGLPVTAERFYAFHSIEDLRLALRQTPPPYLILGGGSNMLFTQNPQATVLKNEIGGMEVLRTFKNKVWVKVGGGVVWHDFVLWAVAQGLAAWKT